MKKLTIEREGALTKIEIKTKAKNNRRRMVRARYVRKSLRKKVCSSDETRKVKDILLVLDK